MATPFETYIQTELPLRSATLLPAQCGGWDDDPNLVGAPAILQNAPVGTFYWEATATKFWRKKGGPGTWAEEGGGGGGGGVTTYATELALLAATPTEGTIGYAQDSQRYWFRGASSWAPKANLSTQIGSLIFPIDYATGTDPDPGTVFCTAADITAYMADRGITYFKTIIGCFRCLPDVVTSFVYFYLQPGIHRPAPTTMQYLGGAAFPFKQVQNSLTGVTRYPLIFQESARILITPANGFNHTLSWDVFVAANTCTGASNSNTTEYGFESYLDFSGATFTPNALRGYFVRIPTATAQILPIRDNTATRIYLGQNYSGAPVGLSIPVVSPATILRNSWDDATPAYANDAMILLNADRWTSPPNSTRFAFEGIRFDQFSTAGSYPTVDIAGPLRTTFARCQWDQARLRNEAFTNVAGTTGINQNFTETPAFVALTACTFRGLRIAASPVAGSKFMQLGFATFRRYALDLAHVTLSNCFIAGHDSNGTRIANSRVEVTNCMWDANQPATVMEIQACGIIFNASTPLNFVRIGSRALSFVACKATITCAFQQITSELVAASESECTLLRSEAGIGGGNTGRHFSIGDYSRIVVKPTWVCAMSTTPEIAIGSGGMSLANLRAAVIAETQPGGTLAGAVFVDQIVDTTLTTTDATCTLKFTAVGTLLQFHHVNDTPGAYGTGVNVSAGGRFQLKGANTAYWCIVDVIASNLPGTDSTQNFYITHRTFVFPEMSFLSAAHG